MGTYEDLYKKIYLVDCLPKDHIAYLEELKRSGFEPKVIYDIGSCVLHWTRHAARLWPNAQIILFEANPHCEFLYSDYKYHIGVLSNKSKQNVKFYLNDISPGGSSYYKEVGSVLAPILYPESKFLQCTSMTLDDVVAAKEFPLPDLVKMDVQGAEKDILEGGINTLQNTTHLILEIPKPNIIYNQGAPSGKETIEYAEKLGWKCTAPLFCDNGEYDGDYGFSRPKVDNVHL